MRKLILYLLVFAALLTVVGCAEEETIPHLPSNWEEITASDWNSLSATEQEAIVVKLFQEEYHHLPRKADASSNEGEKMNAKTDEILLDDIRIMLEADMYMAALDGDLLFCVRDSMN